MNYFIKQQNERIDYNYREYVVNTSADLEKIPEEACPGSIVFVMNEGKMMMLNLDNEWKEF